MKLLFKQRFFSWFDSYDIYDEQGNTVYQVEGELSWGHCLHIKDVLGTQVGTVKEKVFQLLPRFEIFENGRYIGCISKEFHLFRPVYHIEYNGWRVEGNFLEWDYTILDSQGGRVAVISKELLNWTDTYALDVVKEEDTLHVLMFVLAVDAEKCSRR